MYSSDSFNCRNSPQATRAAVTHVIKRKRSKYTPIFFCCFSTRLRFIHVDLGSVESTIVQLGITELHRCAINRVARDWNRQLMHYANVGATRRSGNGGE